MVKKVKTKRDDDPDETEGRRIYRQKADILARFSFNLERVRKIGEDHVSRMEKHEECTKRRNWDFGH